MRSEGGPIECSHSGCPYPRVPVPVSPCPCPGVPSRHRLVAVEPVLSPERARIPSGRAGKSLDPRCFPIPVFPRALSLRGMPGFGSARVLCAGSSCGTENGDFSYFQPRCDGDRGSREMSQGGRHSQDTAGSGVQELLLLHSGSSPCPRQPPSSPGDRNTSLTKFLVFSSPSLSPIKNKPSPSTPEETRGVP